MGQIQRSERDTFYMRRCLFLAKKAMGYTAPNPMVGCVIVYNDKIIGEGWHQKAGSAHAEINAIAAVKDKSLLRKSTLYVNLEPCSHFGKTPPCADALIQHEIPRVVIATLDPNSKVAGKGVASLRAHGCEVQTGVLNKEALFLNRRFFCFHQNKRPYVLLKWAQTKDGFIAPLAATKKDKSVFWISNLYAQQKAHQWRSEQAAILVGVQTVVDDNPQLNLRHWSGPAPLRCVIDPNNRIPNDSKLLTDTAAVLIFNATKSQTLGNKTWVCLADFSIPQLLNYLYKKEIQSVLVEGGQKTLQHFIDQQLWDEARVFESNTLLKIGVKAPQLLEPAVKTIHVDSDRLSFFNPTAQTLIEVPPDSA